MGKMTKDCIIGAIAKEASLTKAQAKAAYDALVNVAYKGAKEEDAFALPGLGKFAKSVRAAHEGRNPKTGETIKIAASENVRFKLAKQAVAAILGK